MHCDLTGVSGGGCDDAIVNVLGDISKYFRQLPAAVVCVCIWLLNVVFFFIHAHERKMYMYLRVIDNAHFMVLQLIVTCTENCSTCTCFGPKCTCRYI